jgi:hypothetical protein
MLEQRVFISEMDTLEKAVSSFLHLCFVGNFNYPVGSAFLSTYLQRRVAKIDENGTKSTNSKKNQLAKEDKSARLLEKAINDFKVTLFDLTN